MVEVFLFMYEYGTLKSAEVTLRGVLWRRTVRKLNQTDVHSMHI
jgi:hypothetical protein